MFSRIGSVLLLTLRSFSSPSVCVRRQSHLSRHSLGRWVEYFPQVLTETLVVYVLHLLGSHLGLASARQPAPKRLGCFDCFRHRRRLSARRTDTADIRLIEDVQSLDTSRLNLTGGALRCRRRSSLLRLFLHVSFHVLPLERFVGGHARVDEVQVVHQERSQRDDQDDQEDVEHDQGRVVKQQELGHEDPVLC